MYGRDSLKTKVLRNLTSTSTESFRHLWFNIQHKKLKSILMCAVYRPPDCPVTCLTDDFVPKYQHSLTLQKDTIITGDLNCHLLSSSLQSRSPTDLCRLMNLSQLISESTRVTEETNTLINVDLVWNSALVFAALPSKTDVPAIFNLLLSQCFLQQGS